MATESTEPFVIGLTTGRHGSTGGACGGVLITPNSDYYPKYSSTSCNPWISDIHTPQSTPQPNAPCTLTGSPSRAGPSGYPLGAFAAQVRAAETPDVIMTPVSSVWSSQVFPERPVNTRYWQGKFPSKPQFAETMWRHSLLMPPGKKTKNTSACVFTVANVLGTWGRYHHPLLIYRY